MEQPKGNVVTYHLPVDRRRVLRSAFLALAVFVALAGTVAFFSDGHGLGAIATIAAGFSTMVFGANTLVYNLTGSATAPTAAVMRQHQTLAVTVTGDGAATSIVITHNWGLSTAQINALLPDVYFEPILAAGITAAPIVTTRAANTVTLTCTAFTGAGLVVKLRRFQELQ